MSQILKELHWGAKALKNNTVKFCWLELGLLEYLPLLELGKISVWYISFYLGSLQHWLHQLSHLISGPFHRNVVKITPFSVEQKKITNVAGQHVLSAINTCFQHFVIMIKAIKVNLHKIRGVVTNLFVMIVLFIWHV
jgi:hypothetical protein